MQFTVSQLLRARMRRGHVDDDGDRKSEGEGRKET